MNNFFYIYVNTQIADSAVTIANHPYSIDGSKLEISTDTKEDIFAVIEFSGTQYKVTLVSFSLSSNILFYDICNI